MKQRRKTSLVAGACLLFSLAASAVFIKVAQAYGKRKGISYSTWRSAGVSAHVLQAAGITRGRS